MTLIKLFALGLGVLALFGVVAVVYGFIFLFRQMFGLREEDEEYGEAPHNRAEVIRALQASRTRADFVQAMLAAGVVGLCGAEEDKAANRAFRRLRRELTTNDIWLAYSMAEPGGLLAGRLNKAGPAARLQLN